MPNDIMLPMGYHTKKDLITQIKKKTNEELIAALKKCADERVTFPKELQEDIDTFYSALELSSKSPRALQAQKQALNYYIEDTAINNFKVELDKKFTEEAWPLKFMYVIAQHFNLKINYDPYVQAEIKDGKVYWQIKKNDNIILKNDLLKEDKEFKFHDNQCWYMTWHQFCLFKNSGKRGGNYPIGKEDFISYFPKIKHCQAEAIWHDMINKNILNSRHRFSEEWYASKNININLESIDESYQFYITEDSLKECLDSLKNDNIDKDTFINYWETQKLNFAAKEIWDIFIKNKLIKNGFLIKNVALSKIQLPHHTPINYSEILDVCYDISNDDKTYALERAPNLFNVRSDRNFKSWSATGRLQNRAQDKDSRVDLFDVGTHRNLSSFTRDKAVKNMEFDHIPAQSEIAHKKTIELKKLQGKLKKENSNKKPDKTITNDLSKKIETLQNEIDDIGPNSFTIAIPAKLHKQGETWMSKNAAKDSNPFLRDLAAYFEILSTRFADFSLTLGHYMLFLGATRLLYKRNATEAKTINNISTINNEHLRFFNNANKKELDKLFNSEIQKMSLR